MKRTKDTKKIIVKTLSADKRKESTFCYSQVVDINSVIQVAHIERATVIIVAKYSSFIVRIIQ